MKGKSKHEPVVLRAEDLSILRGEIEPHRLLPVLDRIALQLSAYKHLSPVRLWSVGLPLLGLVLSITCHNTDVHLPFDGGSIKEGVWSFVDPPGSSRMKTIRPRPEIAATPGQGPPRHSEATHSNRWLWCRAR